MRRPALLRALMATALLTASCFGGPAPSPPPPAPGTPPAPPSTPWAPDQFGIGVTAQPPDLQGGGWVTQSAVPFEYAYQYLAGNVTGNGWQTWNADAQFPLWYAQDADDRGATPVFPYYMLLPSTGPCDTCGEAEQDLAHLNSDSLMASHTTPVRL